MYTEFIRAVSLCNGGVPVFYFQMIGAAVCPRDIKGCIDGQRECAVCPAIDGDRDGIAGGAVKQPLSAGHTKPCDRKNQEQDNIIFMSCQFVHKKDLALPICSVCFMKYTIKMSLGKSNES